MIRYYFVIIINMFRLPWIIGKMRWMADHLGKYSKEVRYRYAQQIVKWMQQTGGVKTIVTGEENLPKEGGYMLYPNHQGKYDVYGILSVHDNPCSFVMDKAKSYIIFVREALEMLEGKRLDIHDVRQAMTVIKEMTEDVKKGARYILFPEGGYDKNGNSMGEFKAGCFKISLKSQTPVIPVAIVDSYKVFNANCLGRVTTQVHYLEPILYEEYKNMKTQQLALLVKERIQAKLDEVLG